MTVLYTTSAALLSSCGPPDMLRLVSGGREINLVEFLPSHLKDSEVNDFTEFFQDFLNSLYFEKHFPTSATGLEIFNRRKISILEKITRLTELHDPSLVDIEYIQFFANYLG